MMTINVHLKVYAFECVRAHASACVHMSAQAYVRVLTGYQDRTDHRVHSKKDARDRERYGSIVRRLHVLGKNLSGWLVAAKV